MRADPAGREGEGAGTPASWLRTALACLLAFLLGCAALELGLRFLLFSDSAFARRAGARLRQPWLYADRWSEEDYWKLMQRFQGDPGPLPQALAHPRLGWTSGQFDPVTYRHGRLEALAGRRPIALFGDSFAQCNTPQSSCFEGILEHSELRERYALLNYGVRAYGLDQVYLLLESALEALLPLEPVVVVGLCVDDVFDRSVLDFRGWPKPRLELAHGQLALARPGVDSLEGYLEDHPLEIASFAWRAFLHGTDLVPGPLRELATREEALRREKQELNGRILDALEDLLSSRGVDHFFLVFHGQPQLGSREPVDWREELLLDFLRRRRVPFRSSREFLHEDSYLEGRDLGQYYGVEGQLNAHWNELGNRVVFRAFVEGLAGRFEPSPAAADGTGAPPVDPSRFEGRSFSKGQVVACFARGLRPPYARADEQERLCLRVMREGPTRIEYALGGSSSRFEAVARVPELASFPERCGKVRLRLLVDGRTAWEELLQRGDPDRIVSVELAGGQRLAIEARGAGDGIDCDYVTLASPRFLH